MPQQIGARLARRLARVEATHEIRTVLARCQYLLAAQRFDEVLGLCVQHDPAVSVRVEGLGEQVGLDAIREFLVRATEMAPDGDGRRRTDTAAGQDGDARDGLLAENALLTPYVHVDRDATRARGVWMVLGASSRRTASSKPDAEWLWAHLEVDLVPEDGAWRIRRARIVPRFRTPFDQDWVETARRARRAGEHAPGYSPDAPPAYDPVVPDEVAFEPDEEQPTAELAGLQRRITALEDVWAIENLMSRHEYLHAAGLNEEELDTCFALSEPDLSFEPEDWGVWEGAEAIRLCYVDGAPPVGPGMMTEHATSTALVVVADDGRTAKGVWMSPGHETFAGPEGDAHVFWSWGRYGVDFVKENGRWKFWHFHIYTTFRTPFATSWVDSALGPRMFDFAEGETPPGMTPPTRGTTDNTPYHPSRAPRLLPEPPRPYATFSETVSFTPRPE
ncbi:nuclear transport factor 2 family protein [Streptomyces sp. NPDC047043]|uniref:nuclear transport factor 2 family protein n=1 Tax=Streptomyces sp. NPDC047043 TaxID=3154497 RepID=UPI0033DFFA16